jgi:hypothetical protein
MQAFPCRGTRRFSGSAQEAPIQDKMPLWNHDLETLLLWERKDMGFQNCVPSRLCMQENRLSYDDVFMRESDRR